MMDSKAEYRRQGDTCVSTAKPNKEYDGMLYGLGQGCNIDSHQEYYLLTYTLIQ